MCVIDANRHRYPPQKKMLKKTKTSKNRMMRMTKKQRKTRTMAAPIQLSSQILMKPQENEKPSRTRRTKPDEPGEDEGEGEGDQDEEKKKLKRRKPNTCLPQSNQRSNKLLRSTQAHLEHRRF